MFSTLRVPTEENPAPIPAPSPLPEEKVTFEGMSLSQKEVDEIKSRRDEVESIKAGIESEHVNSNADLVMVFQIALNRAQRAVALRQPIKP